MCRTTVAIGLQVPLICSLTLSLFPTCMTSGGLGRQIAVRSSGGQTWNYKDKPESTWPEKYPLCAESKMQSPIDIDTSHVMYSQVESLQFVGDYQETNLEKLKRNGFKLHFFNNGHTAEIQVEGGETFMLNGGGLPSDYKLEQFHFHWSDNVSRGSEHSINGESYPLELHMVHYKEFYQNVNEAANRPHGLAVLSILYNVSETAPDVFADLPMERVKHKDESVEIPIFDVMRYLPKNAKNEFYHYSGSLTTPPCYESVEWFIFRGTHDMSWNDLHRFQSLMETERGERHQQRIQMNVRSTQPLGHSRAVHASFDTGAPSASSAAKARSVIQHIIFSSLVICGTRLLTELPWIS